MMKKIVFSLLLCSSLFGLSACEDKAEKRAKLQAQIEDAEDKVNECVYKNLHKGDINNCKELQNQQDALQKELDKLNGIN